MNALSPSDKVLCVASGVFGDRFGTIAKKYGANVVWLRCDCGQAADPEEVRRALSADPQIKAMLVTHNETCTGVTNDLGAISAVVKAYQKLLLVDAISSLGCVDLPVDKRGCDVVAAGSQKGFMVPPCLAFVSVSQRAWQAHREARMPRFYWDFSQAKSYLEKGETPRTPAVPIFFALGASVEMIFEEGLGNVFARHARVAQRAREGAKSLGLSLFATEGHASNTVTAVNSPGGVDSRKLLEVLRAEHGMVLAGGQERLAANIFRIGHLGYVSEADIDEVMAVLRLALPKVGFVPAR